MVEEDVVEIIDTADAPLLRESAELVFVHEDFLVLSSTDALARLLPCSEVSYIGHVSPDAVIQLATALIEDVHVQNPPVIVEALAGSYSLVAIQGPL